jgi:hypothetical protein
VERRKKDQSNVKVYEQKRTVEYADYKVGLIYISPFDLFVEGEAVITKLEKKDLRYLALIAKKVAINAISCYLCCPDGLLDYTGTE